MSAFYELKSLLDDVSDSALCEALYMMRYPRHLIGIIPATKQFIDWCERYPVLSHFYGDERDATSLKILKKIAELEVAHEIFIGKK